MSQEDVDIVRNSLKALAERGVDGLAEFWDADISWRAMAGAPDDVGEMRGTDAAHRYVQDWFDTFDGLSVEPLELLDAGDGRVIAMHHVTGRARLSGIETELDYAVVYTLREGKIVRCREYAARGEALETVGLAE